MIPVIPVLAFVGGGGLMWWATNETATDVAEAASPDIIIENGNVSNTERIPWKTIIVLTALYLIYRRYFE